MNKDIIWRIAFIGGYFEFIYKADLKIVEVWKHFKSGSARKIDTMDVDHPSIGENEMSLIGNAYIHGICCEDSDCETEREVHPRFAQAAIKVTKYGIPHELSGIIREATKSAAQEAISNELNSIVDMFCSSVVKGVEGQEMRDTEKATRLVYGE